MTGACLAALDYCRCILAAHVADSPHECACGGSWRFAADGEFIPVVFPTIGVMTTAVGVTASRDGLTEPQADLAYRFLDGLRATGATELHHGDCVGGDAALADMARDLGYRLIAHPPTAPVLRAHVPSDVVLPATGYLARNRRIVDDTHVLVAFPNTPEEQVRSGTWSTVRYARQVRRRHHVVGPAGDLVEVGR